LILTFFTACKSSSPIITSKKTAKAKDNNVYLADKLINSASKNIGIRYKIGGTTNSGYDCSGLVYSTFDLYEIKLPRTSLEQSKTGVVIDRNTGKAKKGDLIFFKTNNSSKINHVGIVIEVIDDEIKFIHTSISKGVRISSTKEAYYQKRFAQLNRVLQ
jgi:cell wall-associated NlpC family hydrolase